MESSVVEQIERDVIWRLASARCDACRDRVPRHFGEHNDGGERDDCEAYLIWMAAETLVKGAQSGDMPDIPECNCDGGEQGEGLVSVPHEPHCPLA